MLQGVALLPRVMATENVTRKLGKKEVGKVKPIRIPREKEVAAELSLKVEQMNNLNSTKKPWRESEEEEVSLMENSPAVTPLVIQSFDPTKDFYTSSGRPVSPTQLPPPPDTEDNLESSANPGNSIPAAPKMSEGAVQGRTSGALERVKVVVRSRPLSEKEKSERYEW